jgi:hypothetical protein
MAGTLAQTETSGKTAPSARLLALEAGVAAIAVATVYLLFVAGSHNEGYDGIGYLSDIRAGDAQSMLHPSHLLFNWLGWLAYHAALTLGFHGGPLRPVQVMNALVGGVGVGLLWLLLRNAGLDRVVTAGGCGMLAFSYGYWGYSEDVELYPISTTLLILTLVAAHHAAMTPSWRTFGLFGMANGLAMLGHNTAALLIAVAFTALVISSRRPLLLRKVVLNAFAYAAGAAAVVIPAYAVAIPIVGLHSPSAFYDWLTSQTQNSHADNYTGAWQFTTLPRALIGAARALMGGHFALSLPALRDFVGNHFQDKNLRTELFLSRDFNHVAAVLLLTVAACAASAIALNASAWLSRPKLDPPARMLALLSVAWAIPYAVFFAWWEPINLKFWIALWVPLTILVVLPLPSLRNARWKRAAPVMLSVIVAGLFVVNLFGSVLPETQKSNDYWRARTDWYENNTGPSDVIFTSSYLHAEYLRYFTRARVVDVRLDIAYASGEDRVVSEVQRIIDASPAARVLFSSEALFPGDDPYSHCVEPNCRIGQMLRDAYLGGSHVIADEPTEKVWQFERR